MYLAAAVKQFSISLNILSYTIIQEYLLSHSLVLAVLEGHSEMLMMVQHVLIYHHHRFHLDRLPLPLHMYVKFFLLVLIYTYLSCLQISSNGLISFGSSFLSWMSRFFPIVENVVALYWTDINLAVKGVVRYDVVTHSHPTLSCLLGLTNNLIRERGNAEFNASWLLVTRWIDACPFGNRNCAEVLKSMMS